MQRQWHKLCDVINTSHVIDVFDHDVIETRGKWTHLLS